MPPLRAERDWLFPAVMWGIRFSLLIFLVTFLKPSPGYVTLDDPQEVVTQRPVLCVHTRLTDEVEEWKIQRSLVAVREMGAPVIVEFFPWAYNEPEEDQYSWSHSDLIVQHARNQGLKIIARLGIVPDWARPDPEITGVDTSLNYIDEDHYDDFADFVEVFTARYREDISMIIIWNEPNLAFEWGYQAVDPVKYINLLKVVVPAARRGNPGIEIVAGALAPTLEPEGSPFGLRDTDYLEALYSAGFSDYYDILAVHTYGFKFPPEDEPSDEVLNFRRIELLREIMVDAGDGEKPIIITEYGWNDHPRWTRAVSPSQRIHYTLDALEYVIENYPYVEHACIWALRYPTPTNSYPDYFTLISPDFSPKPIYEALKDWSRGGN